MSKFITTVAMADVLGDFRKQLPAGSVVIGHRIEGNALTVEWENPGLQTAYLYACPFPVEALTGELPAGVAVKRSEKLEVRSEKAETAAPVESGNDKGKTLDTPRRRGRKGGAT